MGILIVDDSHEQLLLYKKVLTIAGYNDIFLAGSANEALKILKDRTTSSGNDLDIILMDIMMPGIDGIEACRLIKAEKRFEDIPIVVITGSDDVEKFQKAFSAGAVDYIKKPMEKIELVARVNSVVRFKHEMDRRKAHEKELEELTRQLGIANQMLTRLAILDGLTGIPNRRYFDDFIDQEWLRAARDRAPISLILIDIDYFKLFNDVYGHQAGDECLKRIAATLKNTLKRPADLIARYGGEEFVAVLPETELKGAVSIAEDMRLSVQELKIPHAGSMASEHITISLGVSSTIPDRHSSFSSLVAGADKALYGAKDRGRNQVRTE